MALLPRRYNTEDNNATMEDRSPLPNGDYVMVIDSSQIKATKAKTGHYLALTFKVLSPASHKGKVVFENLNLDNPNPIAVEIAEKTLNTICQACNKPGVEDSDELHGIPMLISIVEDDSNPQYPGNKITAYNEVDPDSFEIEESPPPQQKQQKKTGGKLPWQP